MSREMKDSGIEWIGEIPKGWKVCKVKQILRNKSIKGFPYETYRWCGYIIIVKC